jgi:hypothetical protein
MLSVPPLPDCRSPSCNLHCRRADRYKCFFNAGHFYLFGVIQTQSLNGFQNPTEILVQTVLAPILGTQFLQEQPSPQIIIGFILVFGAVVVSETGSAVIEKEAGGESQPD